LALYLSVSVAFKKASRGPKGEPPESRSFQRLAETQDWVFLTTKMARGKIMGALMLSH
jgi:hypothetical protein